MDIETLIKALEEKRDDPTNKLTETHVNIVRKKLRAVGVPEIIPARKFKLPNWVLWAIIAILVINETRPYLTPYVVQLWQYVQ